jgi:uncharacterized protein (TIGR02284 family)
MTNAASATIEETVSVLNDLVSTCIDGVEGFRTAAEAVKNNETKMLFQSRVRVIETSQAELTAAVRRLGGDPATHGHIVGSLHRGWVDIKAMVTGKNEEAVLAEVIRGEEGAVEHYRDALKKALPQDVVAMVERQYQGAQENLERVRNLAESARTASRGASESSAAPRSTDVRSLL